MQATNERRSNKQRSEETRSLLITVARDLFRSQGYAETGTPEIVAKAKVTRGALYHHFDGKQALFLAVAMQAANEVTAAIRLNSNIAGTPLESLHQGAKAYFTAMAEHDRAHLLLLQAPAILDNDQLLVLSNAAGSNELKEGLLSILSPARVKNMPIDALTAMVSASFDRAALEIAKGAPAADFENAIGLLLDGLAAK